MRFTITFLFVTILSTITYGQNGSSEDKLNYRLMDAAWSGNTDSVLYYIDNGADVNARNKGSEETALMYAAQEGHLDVVKILLENGAKPDLIPNNNEGALIRATAMGYIDIVEELIRAGSNVNQSGKLSQKPLHYAAKFGYYYIVDMLIYYEADVNAKARYDVTPLMTAIVSGFPSIAELLLQNNADPNATDSEGFTPLMLASKYAYHKLAGLMIQKGARVDKTTNGNNTALTLAIPTGNVAIADTLLQNGANANHQINNKLTPLTLAKSTANDSIVTLLKQYNAKRINTFNFDNSLWQYSISANTDDALFGLHYGYHEARTNTNLTLGFSMRYFAKRVLQEKSSNTIHQYWERRYLIPLTLDYLINLSSEKQNQFALIAGVKGYYTWGRYRGVNQKPNANFGLNPRVGLLWKPKDKIGLTMHYEYFELNQKTVSPHRLTFGFNLFLPRTKSLKDVSEAEQLILN
ncbi:MAG: ankyrin repeat domain-containing protein [Bacteroidales bacterium]|nr:ankyrin repeat domain-containing protein [Bacteroidales bacterium]